MAVWGPRAEAWDGQTDSDCHFFQVASSTWVGVTRSLNPPVPDDLCERILALPGRQPIKPMAGGFLCILWFLGTTG